MVTLSSKRAALLALAGAMLLSACSSSPSRSAPGVATVATARAAPGTATPNTPGPRCAGVQALLVVDADEPELQMAFVSQGALPPKLVFARSQRVGVGLEEERLAPAPIMSITPQGVWLPDRGSRCFAPLVVAEGAPAVRRIGDRKFLTDVASFSTIGRVRVAPVHPAAASFLTLLRLSEIREGSLLRAIGIEDGDVLISVNHVETTLQDDMARGFEKLYSTDELDFFIKRDEERLRIELHIER